MSTQPNGTRIGDRYIVEGELGRGASAVVFLATDIQHDRQVAVKCLHKELSYALGAQRFLREIHITAKMQHPHILPIHDSGEWNNTLYYVMPKASADFKTCGVAHAMRLDKRVSYASILDFSALLRALSPRRDTNVDPDPPAWVSCAYGCCTFGEGA
jgi:hypothetical protein